MIKQAMLKNIACVVNIIIVLEKAAAFEWYQAK